MNPDTHKARTVAFASLENQIEHFLSQSPAVLHGQNMLARMQSLADHLGNPEKQLKIIHVAGTSGKTSTSYFATAMLQQAGLTTGLTISPHVDTVRERAMINLQPLSESDWTKHMTEFFDIVQKSNIQPSYFEFYMNFAFWLFAKLGVDYAVVETGLGGTWDGSNITVSPDKICIITDIGYDHTEVLGHDIASITYEKAGIIHQNNNAFSYQQSPEITVVLQQRATTVHAKLHLLTAIQKTFFARNFYLARQAVEFALDRKLTKKELVRAHQTPIPARAETIRYQDKTIILDGSHNPQKLQALKDYINQKYPAKSRTLIFALGDNKQSTMDASFRVIKKIASSIILTSFTHNNSEARHHSSIAPDLLQVSAARAGFSPVIYTANPLTALQQALKQPTDQIVITGSFYLLSHLRPILLSKHSCLNQSVIS